MSCQRLKTPMQCLPRSIRSATRARGHGTRQGRTCLTRTDTMTISALLEEISSRHFPNPPASPREIEEFEQRMGWKLDPDLRAFYLHCNGAKLFTQPDSPFRF